MLDAEKMKKELSRKLDIPDAEIESLDVQFKPSHFGFYFKLKLKKSHSHTGFASVLMDAREYRAVVLLSEEIMGELDLWVGYAVACAATELNCQIRDARADAFELEMEAACA